MSENKELKPSKLDVFFKLKYIAFLISLLFMVCGIVAIAIGIKHLVYGIIDFIGIQNVEGQPGIQIISAVDTLLFAIVILVLGGGIYKLFVGNELTFKNSVVFSKIKTFMDLKVLLWQTLLLTLTVWCALGFFTNPDDFKYEQLILPVAILLLSLSLKLMKGVKE